MVMKIWDYEKACPEKVFFPISRASDSSRIFKSY